MVFNSVCTLFKELVNGSAPSGGWVLNPNDRGLLASLEQLTSEEASEVPSGGGASIAAHLDHLCYGLSLLNRWGDGEKDPFSDADYKESWGRNTVSEREWMTLRNRLRDEVNRWCEVLENPRAVDDMELNGVIASAAHLAYHLGAIRQMNRSLRGPSADESESPRHA
jgi:hypothetical protein